MTAVTAAMSRRRKVRWSHRTGCGHYVLSGQVVISHDGGRTWTCRPCALAGIASERAATKDGPSPLNTKG